MFAIVVGNAQQSAMCSSTYLLFHPNDETMLQNKDYYMQNTDASPLDFSPRQVISISINELLMIAASKLRGTVVMVFFGASFRRNSSMARFCLKPGFHYPS